MRRLYGLLAPLVAAPLLGAVDPASVPLAAPAPPICHVDAKDEAAPPAKAILTGYGTGGFAVATGNPEAQAYFTNGMQLAHAFAHTAATGAFKRAEQLDPACAMCVWGEAWSRGPTINYPIKKEEQADLAALADKAAVLGAANSPKERALIAALQKRYHDGGGKGPGDFAFARAMDDLATTYPDDNEIAVIAADAWMIPAAHKDSRDHLDRSLALLEGALDRSPEDTGAIHFYIHATEMDGMGWKALPWAEKLGVLAPAASHLVHMPSHTDFWVGRYRMAEQSNLDAVKIDLANAERLKPKDGVFGLVYHNHNVQFAEGAALMDGDGVGGLPLAATVTARLPKVKPDDIYSNALLGTAYFVYARYADKATIDALPQPGMTLPYARAMWRYMRAEAAAHRGDLAALKTEAEGVRVSGDDLKSFKDDRGAGEALVTVARLVLVGRIAMMERRYSDAEAAYRRAADVQEAKLDHFADPPFWWYPVRRSVAAALLAQGKPDRAIQEAEKAMVRWPYDPVALKIVSDAQLAQGRTVAAQQPLAWAKANWTGDIAALPPALL